MEHRDAIAEHRASALLELRCQADLRNQQQRRASGTQGVRGGAQVHLGLTATGHSVQQRRVQRTLVDSALHRAQGELLIGGQDEAASSTGSQLPGRRFL